MTARSFAALLAIALVLLLIFLGGENVSAGRFKIHDWVYLGCEGDDGVLGTGDDSCAGSPYTPGVTADLEHGFFVNSPWDGAPATHSHFADIVWFSAPPEWKITRGNTVNNGTLRARVYGTFTLSVLNGPCTTTVPASIPLFDATTDRSLKTDWVGWGETLLNDPDGDGLPNYVNRYPSYLHFYTPGDGWMVPPMQPLARLAGHTYLTAGAAPTHLEYLIFDPNRQSDSTLGYQIIAVLNNPVNWEMPPWPNAITELCEPVTLDTHLYGKTQGKGQLYAGWAGTEFDVPDGSHGVPDQRCRTNPANWPWCGTTALTNPPANTGVYLGQTHLIGGLSQSWRDMGDGIPNSEDSCPFTNDTIPPTDLDNDGLYASCDPNDFQTNHDQDGDGFQNREDNCPVDANPDQYDGDWLGADLGPGDSIGDACDPNPVDRATEGPFLEDYVRDAVCLGVDSDADGWCDAEEWALGSYPGINTSRPENTRIDPWTVGTCSNQAWYATAGDPIGAGAQIDDDGDTWINAADGDCWTPSGDNDRDGVSNAYDNCLNNYNSEQLNTDGDTQGDACDADDDNDRINDRLEVIYGGVPDDANFYGQSGFGLDIDGNTVIQISDVVQFRGNTSNKPATQAGWNPDAPEGAMAQSSGDPQEDLVPVLRPR